MRAPLVSQTGIPGDRLLPPTPFFMDKAIVTSKGQVTIPLKLRRKYRIKAGTKICFLERGHEIILQPVTKEYFHSLVGMFKSKTSMTKALLRERARDKKREEAKFKKLKKLSGSR